jgi:hypothetical protein
MGSGRITAPNIDNITTGVRRGNEMGQCSMCYGRATLGNKAYSVQSLRMCFFAPFLMKRQNYYFQLTSDVEDQSLWMWYSALKTYHSFRSCIQSKSIAP